MPGKDARPVIVNDWNASFHLIQTPVGLVVDSLNLQGKRVEIGTDPFSLKVDRPGTWEAFIEEAAVQMFLENQAPDTVREIQVKLGVEGIRVSGKAKVLIEIGIEALCSIEIREGRQLWAVVDAVSIGGSAAKSLVQQQLDKVNPILDVADLPFQLRFQKVEVREGEIVASGTLEP